MGYKIYVKMGYVKVDDMEDITKEQFVNAAGQFFQKMIKQDMEITQLLAWNKKLKEALKEIIKESGDMDIDHWPVPQQACQAIARNALKGK